MSHRRDDRAPSGSARGRRSGWMVAFLAASLGLLGVILAVPAAAAPRDDAGRVVPTRIHDRAQAEGEVRVLVELSLPSRRVGEGALSPRARAAYRREIVDTAARVLDRLDPHPPPVLRPYPPPPQPAVP